MAKNGFKCIYLVCVDHNNDINHVIGRNPSLKKARGLASDARAKWPDRDIYISVEKALENPMATNDSGVGEHLYVYPKAPEEATPEEPDPEGANNNALSEPVSPNALCICGKQVGECVGELSCRCNALAKCKNIDLSRDNPFDTQSGWGLSSTIPKDMHKVLVHVEEIKRGIINVLIPDWNEEEIISFSANELPSEALNAINEGHDYFFANVNLDAKNTEGLVIEFIELDVEDESEDYEEDEEGYEEDYEDDGSEEDYEDEESE